MNFLLTPQEEQMMLAQTLRGKNALVDASKQGNRLNTLAAVSQMINNPGAAAATKVAAKSAQEENSPIQLGNQGFMLPGSGDFVESPMYIRDKLEGRKLQEGMQQDRLAAQTVAQQERLAAQAERERQRIEAQAERERLTREAAAERQAQALAHRQTLALTLAALKAEQAKTKNGGLPPGVKEGDMMRMQKMIADRQIPKLSSSARQLMQAIQEAETNKTEVPGFTVMEQLYHTAPLGMARGQLSPKAQKNIQAMQGISNAMLREGAGLSQTLSEAQRQALEQMASPTTPYDVRVRAFKDHILPLVELSRSSTLGAFNPEALRIYRERQQEVEGDTSWMDSIVPPAAAATADAPPKGVPPEVWNAMTPQEKSLWKK